MNAAFLAPLCIFALACGGAQTPTGNAIGAVSAVRPESDPASTSEDVHESDHDVEVALRRIAREQQESQRLMQNLAHQVEVLQVEVVELRAQQEILKDRPAPSARPARPSRPRPNPLSVYAIPIQDNPTQGSKRPLVTIVKGFEFACQFCHRVGPTLDQLLQEYKGDLRVVHKHFIVHPATATEPALAACAAGKQGKWVAMSQLIWDKAFETRNFSPKKMESLARAAKLNMRIFRSDRDGACKELVRQDQADMARVGTRGTPAFYINGRFLSGTRPIEQFRTLIDEELDKAKKRIREDPSLDRANYYEREILNKGLTELESTP